MAAAGGVDAAVIKLRSKAYPKPATFTPTYGTAGFRAEASLLQSTVFRCGLLTAARAQLLGRNCGIMVTASHNPVKDNGVKIVEPDGEMLPQSWEPIATELAQCSSDEAVADLILKLLQDHHAKPANTPLVYIGHDTRPSASTLVTAALAGVQALGVTVIEAGLVTTPQLHFMVHASNHGGPATGLTPSEAHNLYYDTLLGAFEQLVEGTTPLPGQLVVDCANGVGHNALSSGAVERLRAAGLALQLRNTGTGQLNHQCGADFVQKAKVAPEGFEGLEQDARCCSLDGDADRLVYFMLQPSGGVVLLDGDRIAILAAVFIRDLMQGLPPSTREGVKVGVVQTAYANGASTDYITSQLGLQVQCTPTGVKYLHEAAHHFDIGVYFEANGHGTVLFSHQLMQQLQGLQDSCPAARQLLLLSRVINQTVGDALSGVLLVEAILRRKGWALQDWLAMYTDLPSRQTKLTVADRSIFTTTDAERRVLTPAGLQDHIDSLVRDFPAGSRAFVRPSGTEDAVRVYSEAPSQEQADELAAAVGRLVYDKAGGVGQRP